MKRAATSTRFFRVKEEAGQNPYCGIMSFQHFRGEELYSDIVVKPENNMCETEDVECYPIPDYVEQNGRAQGYYPDNTIAYIRVLWKDFEVERGVYNYKFIEDIIEKARSHSQSVIFRLMPHSTRARDDVPEWLKGMIECPERPDGKRVKDSPTDPMFIDLFCEAIERIGERFDNDPTFDAIDICLPGAWGEGHKLELYSDAQILKLFDTYLNSFKHTQLVSQCHRTEFLHYAKKRTNIGWRADGLGDPSLTNGRYVKSISQIEDFWKTAPVSFESYWWMSEWKRIGWPIDELIDKTLQWHITSFNPKSIPIPYEWEPKVKYWLSKMGYHYSIDSFSYPDHANRGDEIETVLKVENIGVAPSYHSIPLFVRLKGEVEFNYRTEIDIKKWMPGKHTERICFELPESLPSGKYSIDITIYDENVKNVYFATDAEYQDGWYSVGEIYVI